MGALPLGMGGIKPVHTQVKRLVGKNEAMATGV
jgi:hypothetical protein